MELTKLKSNKIQIQTGKMYCPDYLEFTFERTLKIKKKTDHNNSPSFD